MEGLVNGSRGVVIGYQECKSKASKYGGWHNKNSHIPIVRFANGVETPVPPVEWKIYQPKSENGKNKKTCRHQIPLKLAWALTIHRAQGMTIDRVQCTLNDTFAYGQGYVALSRVRSLEGLYIKALNKRVCAFFIAIQ